MGPQNGTFFTTHSHPKCQNGCRQTCDKYFVVHKLYIQQCISASVTPRNKITTATPNFPGPGSQWCYSEYCQCNRKSDFQDDGRQTGSTYISASTQNSNETPFERLTQPFYGSSNSMAILRILSDVTGSRLLKTAAVKPEVLISQLRDKIATPFQRRILHFPGLYCPNIARCVTRSQYFKMAAAKQEVLISQLLDKMATAAILNFRLPVKTDGIRNSVIEYRDHENWG